MTPAPLRIANASGFYGDRFSAVREMLEDGPIDVLTGDYLAELTMLILGRMKAKHPELGYVSTFLQQMEDCLEQALRQGVKVVTNAGGLNPRALAQALRDLCDRFGLAASIAVVEGDDLLPRATELEFGEPLTANAYLGAWGIAECLERGADVVVTGRVTDASLVVGPAAHHFGWRNDDWDRLAGATVAGHVIECGAQATGGNFSFFTEIDVDKPGFPIAEIFADGSSVITKHPGTGGAVTTETVTAQLLYEVAGPRYLGPDVTARLDRVILTPDGTDRVRISGVRGEAPPETLKVCINRLEGYRNEVTFVLTGLDIEAKAALVRRQLQQRLGEARPDEIEWKVVRSDRPGATDEEEASGFLRCVVKDRQRERCGRAFSAAAVELGLASYPGLNLVGPPQDASQFGAVSDAYVDAHRVRQTVIVNAGEVIDVPWGPRGSLADGDDPDDADLPMPFESGATMRRPLGTIVGARSGDKGGTANVGFWARDDRSWAWLAHFLTIDQFGVLLPEATRLPIRRYVFANLRALNFVIDGLLGEGVAASTRFDPQAKALGELLRAQLVSVPDALLAAAREPADR